MVVPVPITLTLFATSSGVNPNAAIIDSNVRLTAPLITLPNLSTGINLA